jgi:chemotaxis protein CheX
MPTTDSPVTALPLEAWIADIVPNVFDTMLGITAMPDESGSDISSAEDRLTAFVGLGGEILTGIVYLHFPQALATKVTAGMLGLDPADGISESDVNDVAGELCNMVTSGIKSILSDPSFPCVMTAPAVIRGNKFSIQTVEQTRREVFAFECAGHQLVIEMHLNSVHAGGNTMVIDLSLVETTSLSVINLVLSLLQTARELSLGHAIVAPEKIKSECKSHEEA